MNRVILLLILVLLFISCDKQQLIIDKSGISHVESESEATSATVTEVYYYKDKYYTFYFLDVPGDSEPLNSELADSLTLLLEEGQDLYTIMFDSIYDTIHIYNSNEQVDSAIFAYNEENPEILDSMPSSALPSGDDWLVFYEHCNFEGLELWAGNTYEDHHIKKTTPSNDTV